MASPSPYVGCVPGEFVAEAVEPPLIDERTQPFAWVTWLGRAFRATPDHFEHSVSVWHGARQLRFRTGGWLEPERADLLELAALLHDVGRAIDPAELEPHGVVGARFLDSVGLRSISALVAHHSGAEHAGALRGCASVHDWTVDDVELLNLLSYLDQTTGPRGEPVSLDERRAEKRARLGSGAGQLVVFDTLLPALERTERLIGAHTT